MTTSALSLREVLTSTLKSDSTLQTILGVSASKPHAVFRSGAPSGVPRPYIVVGSSAEDPLKTFGPSGNSGTETLHFWADGLDEAKVMQAYGRANSLLDGTDLLVTGFAPVRGSLRLIFVLPVFEGGKQSMHGVAEYDSRRFAA